MKNTDVTDAFELLLGELEIALHAVREEAAEALQDGRYVEAQARLTTAQRIEQFIADIRAKQREWKALGGSLRRQRKSRGRLPRGERTREEAFRLPILRALEALGGEAKVSVVLDRVYAEMKPRLKPADLLLLPADGRTPRWRNTAQWERRNMVNEGLLRNDCPHGIWAISEKGRKYLAEHGR
jgi:hypothetical protein